MPEDNFDDIPAADDIEEIIPEGLEAEIEETPVPFDDDLEKDLAVEKLLDTPKAKTPPPAARTPAAKKIDPVPEEFEEEIDEDLPVVAAVPRSSGGGGGGKPGLEIPSALKAELKTVLTYMDQLLESLPEEKIEEFARSEYFDSYKKLFKELGLV
jgi:hypothetical protein